MPPASCVLLRALSRWKELWDDLHTTDEAGKKKAIGFTKHGAELWWVTCKVLELARSGGTNSRYLIGVPTDSLRELHEFIKQYATD